MSLIKCTKCGHETWLHQILPDKRVQCVYFDIDKKIKCNCQEVTLNQNIALPPVPDLGKAEYVIAINMLHEIVLGHQIDLKNCYLSNPLKNLIKTIYLKFAASNEKSAKVVIGNIERYLSQRGNSDTKRGVLSIIRRN